MDPYEKAFQKSFESSYSVTYPRTGSVFGLRGRHSPSAGAKRSCGMNGLNGLVEDPVLPGI